MSADNFQVIVHSVGRKHFEQAVRMAFDAAPGGRATHCLNGGLPERQCSECHGQGKRTFWEGLNRKTAVEVTCRECKDGKIPAREAMVLFYWHEDAREGFAIQALPFPLTADAAVEFLWAYLESCKYPREPDQDGSNGKGFLATTGDFWGHVEESHYSILMVAPEWQMYGK